MLQVNNACSEHLTRTYVLVLLSGNHEEILQWLVGVKCRAEVGKVVHELHGSLVYLAIPVTQHGYCRSRICIAMVAVTAITEVVHVGDVVGFCSIEVGTYTHLQKQFATVTVGHLQLNGTQGTEVLAGMIELTAPVATGHFTCGLVADRTGILIGTVDETLVFPIAPAVNDNPGTLLVLARFTSLTVVVKVELDAVIPANHGYGMVHLGTPAVNITHASHTGSIIGCSLGDILPHTARGHTKTDKATCLEVQVAGMVIEPCLGSQTTFLGVHCQGIGCGAQHTVGDGIHPLVIACHPTKVIIRLLLITEERAIGLAAINLGIGHTNELHELVLAVITIGEKPHEVGGILVLGHLAAHVAQGVDFMGEHVADTASTATGTACLVEHRREVLGICIVPVFGQFACCFHTLCLAALRFALHGHILHQSRLCGIRLPRVYIVRILLAVHGNVLSTCGHSTAGQHE